MKKHGTIRCLLLVSNVGSGSTTGASLGGHPGSAVAERRPPPTYPSSGPVESSQFFFDGQRWACCCLCVLMFLVAFHGFFSNGPASMATKFRPYRPRLSSIPESVPLTVGEQHTPLLGSGMGVKFSLSLLARLGRTGQKISLIQRFHKN